MGNPHIHSCCSDGSIPAAFVHQQAMLLCWRLPLAAQVRETFGGASMVPNALNSRSPNTSTTLGVCFAHAISRPSAGVRHNICHFGHTFQVWATIRLSSTASFWSRRVRNATLLPRLRQQPTTTKQEKQNDQQPVVRLADGLTPRAAPAHLSRCQSCEPQPAGRKALLLKRSLRASSYSCLPTRVVCPYEPRVPMG